MDDPLLASLRRAVEAAPGDVPLRLHLARLLEERGDPAGAVAAVAGALVVAPEDEDARAAMRGLLGVPSTAPLEVEDVLRESAIPDGPAALLDEPEPQPDPRLARWLVERSRISLADVGGMRAVKQRLEAAFLAPVRNPMLTAMYGKRVSGGLLMYGPPGCGKTYIARALAGELNASFIAVGIADVLDPYIGNSERAVREMFEAAAAAAPCVLFIDEIDTLGQRRSQTRSSGTRGVVNQLLMELDGFGERQDGVYLLAATNQPWDVDGALRRPGRLDRTVLVLPPDREARAEIFGRALADRPIGKVDLQALAARTEGFSGADIAHVVDAASEVALLESARTGDLRLMTEADLQRALRDVRPSTSEWFESARTMVEFGTDDGTYGDLRAYLKKVKR